MHYVYEIVCKNNDKKYIGITNNPNRRFVEHLKSIPDCNRKLYRAIRKYGKDAFVMNIILIGSRNYCGEFEVKLIELYDTYNNGYNSSLGGEGTEHYIPWNKNTTGLCKANKTSFKPGNKSPREIMTDEDIERLKTEYLSGIPLKQMNWLPVHWAQGYKILKSLNVETDFRKTMNMEFANLLLNKYEEGESQRSLAKEYNMDYRKVNAYIMKAKMVRLANESNTKPNANSADVANSSPSIEPWYRNIFVKDTRVGSFIVKNKYLEKLLESKNKNTKEVWKDIQDNNGSVQHLDFLSEHEKNVFKTAMELDQHWLIELANERGKYVCQAQSLNLFFPAGSDREYVNSVHLKFLKSNHVHTLYYFRTERESKVDAVKNIERKALVDWKSEDCVACQG